jgi:hypothetical protein
LGENLVVSIDFIALLGLSNTAKEVDLEYMAALKNLITDFRGAVGTPLALELSSISNVT